MLHGINLLVQFLASACSLFKFLHSLLNSQPENDQITNKKLLVNSQPLGRKCNPSIVNVSRLIDPEGRLFVCPWGSFSRLIGDYTIKSESVYGFLIRIFLEQNDPCGKIDPLVSLY